MATSRTLREPPITEALVDFRTAPTKPLGDGALESLKATLGKEFPNVATRMKFEARFTRQESGPPSVEGSDTGLHGYFFRSADEAEVAQFRIDGFTYNRLTPYLGGQALLERALKLWSLYSDVAAPSSVVRIALRYINHLRFPGPIEDYAAYLVAPPRAPSELRGHLETFVSRVTIKDPDTSLQVHLRQSSEPGVDGQSVTILLDIDTFRRADEIAKDEIRPTLEALRELKNRAFFSAVTDKALERYS